MKKLDNKGSALAWTLIIIIILSVTVFGVQSLSLSYHSRSIKAVQEKQAFITARGVAIAIAKDITTKDFEDILTQNFLELEYMEQVELQNISYASNQGNINQEAIGDTKAYITRLTPKIEIPSAEELEDEDGEIQLEPIKYKLEVTTVMPYGQGNISVEFEANQSIIIPDEEIEFEEFEGLSVGFISPDNSGNNNSSLQTGTDTNVILKDNFVASKEILNIKEDLYLPLNYSINSKFFDLNVGGKIFHPGAEVNVADVNTFYIQGASYKNQVITDPNHVEKYTLDELVSYKPNWASKYLNNQVVPNPYLSTTRFEKGEYYLVTDRTRSIDFTGRLDNISSDKPIYIILPSSGINLSVSGLNQGLNQPKVYFYLVNGTTKNPTTLSINGDATIEVFGENNTVVQSADSKSINNPQKIYGRISVGSLKYRHLFYQFIQRDEEISGGSGNGNGNGEIEPELQNFRWEIKKYDN